MEWIDLHTHSTASDGTDSPAELVRKAAEAGLCAVALTDHDCIDGLEEAESAGRDCGIEVVRGCELSSGSPFGEVHVLGLWVPRDDADLEAVFAQLRNQRTERNIAILDKLHTLGVHVDYDEVLEVAQGQSVGRPHIAQVLYNHGIVTSVRDSFHRFLGSHCPAYVPRNLWSMEQVVGALAASGATVCLAHPRLIPCDAAWLEQTVVQLKKHGLWGVEAWHSEYSPADERYCVELAARHGLVCTGGSDYHGTVKPRVQLGRGFGSLRVPVDVLDALKKARQSRGLAA